MWFVPLGLATLVGALLAFRFGWIVATITETDVITSIAQRYVTEDGSADARTTDCVGLAGQVQGAWITVRCAGFVYHVNRFGHLIDPSMPERPAI
jgi:hypothetical protein